MFCSQMHSEDRYHTTIATGCVRKQPESSGKTVATVSSQKQVSAIDTY